MFRSSNPFNLGAVGILGPRIEVWYGAVGRVDGAVHDWRGSAKRESGMCRDLKNSRAKSKTNQKVNHKSNENLKAHHVPLKCKRGGRGAASIFAAISRRCDQGCTLFVDQVSTVYSPLSS